MADVHKDYRSVPGMSLSGNILVGKRTLLSYIIDGAMRTALESVREPETWRPQKGREQLRPSAQPPSRRCIAVLS